MCESAGPLGHLTGSHGLGPPASIVGSELPSRLERVMNLGENRIEMRIPRSAWVPRDLRVSRIPKPFLIEFITASRLRPFALAHPKHLRALQACGVVLALNT